MILRIVRMEFQKDKLAEFHEIFNAYKSKIRHSPGCHQLKLYVDHHAPYVLYTYSHWEDEQHLNAYRNSDTFQKVWPMTKALFASKAKAYSLDLVEAIP